ncbi:MAG: hypothetical protein ACYDHN_08225 [Solirubrobacteraceae bacterium]
MTTPTAMMRLQVERVGHSALRLSRQRVALMLALLGGAISGGCMLALATARAEQPELYCSNYYTLNHGCPPPTDWTGWTGKPLYNEGINWSGGWVAMQNYDSSTGYTVVYEACCRNTDYVNSYAEGEKFPKVWNSSNETALIHGRFGV